MLARNIETVGIELEGAWGDENPLPGGFKGDGSVSIASHRAPYVGEVASEILYGWSEAERFSRDNWPLVVNQTCGFHIHLGVQQDTLSALLNRQTWERWHQGARSWAQKKLRGVTRDRALARLHGQSSMCQTNYEAVAHERYRSLNRLAWAEHGTLEVRVWPMPATARTGLQILRYTVSTMDALIRQTRDPRPVLASTKLTIRRKLPLMAEPELPPVVEGSRYHASFCVPSAPRSGMIWCSDMREHQAFAARSLSGVGHICCHVCHVSALATPNAWVRNCNCEMCTHRRYRQTGATAASCNCPNCRDIRREF